ncbi:MAG: hypothetical protein P8Y71_24200 [Pseudolabrys sp.]
MQLSILNWHLARLSSELFLRSLAQNHQVTLHTRQLSPVQLVRNPVLDPVD